ncbi:uncharacterized protein RAG0_04309 [Rhynchosporium agropyri]|uniref:BTB domain-containing protein n=1 Tax=Rhynchosporium agropyri TaxID=914238 RepID=A0A1E1K844_9HELO|nr:uncharacterized protein RAG0_04309 [Rhynchosporium agropyri]
MSNLAAFTIGPEKNKFLIHKKFACEASPIFKSAFNSSFVEGKSQEYVLEDTTEAAFTMFTEWVYTGRLEINFTRYSAETVDRNGKCGLLQCNLMELWLLADKVMAPSLQNRAIWLLAESYSKFLCFDLNKLDRVWEGSGVDSKLRLYILQHFALKMGKGVYKSHGDSFPKEMLLEMSTLHWQNREDKVTAMPSMETFYVKEGI